MVSDCLSPGPKGCRLEKCKGLDCFFCVDQSVPQEHQKGAAPNASPAITKRLYTVIVILVTFTHDL